MVAAVLKILALVMVFQTLALTCSAFIPGFLGVSENLIWFIFGGAFYDVARKVGL